MGRSSYMKHKYFFPQPYIWVERQNVLSPSYAVNNIFCHQGGHWKKVMLAALSVLQRTKNARQTLKS